MKSENNETPEVPDAWIERLVALAEETGEARRSFLSRQRSALDRETIEALKSCADALLVRDPARALRIARVARDAAALSADPLARGVALWAYGNAVFFFEGDFRAALAAYREAQAIYQDAERPLETARLLTNQVAVLRNLAEYDQALETAALARQHLSPLGPTRYLALLEMNVGAVLRHRGRYAAALDAYARGREIFAALDDPVEVARTDINRANVLESLDRFDEAEALLVQARAALDAAGAALEVARADLNLGVTTYRQGRYRAALRHLERAHDGFDDLEEPVETATVDLYRARVYLALNLLPEAIHLAQGARDVLARHDLRRYVAACWDVEARAQRLQGDRLAAMRALERARRVYRQIGDPVSVALIDLERATLLGESGEAGSGARIAARSARFFDARDLPARQAAARVRQARCALDLEKLDRARALAQEARETAEALGLTELAWRAQQILGRVAEREGRTADALVAYRAAVAHLQRLLAALATDEFRAGFLADKIAVYEDGIRLALALGQVAEAFDLTQTAVAVMLLGVPAALEGEEGEAAARPEGQAQEGERAGDRRLRARLAHLRRAWHWKQSALERQDLDSLDADAADANGAANANGAADAGELPTGDEPARGPALIKTVQALETEIADLWRRWQVRQPSGAALARPLSPEEVQAYLAPDEALIQYVVVEGKIGAFLVRPDCFKVRPDLASVSDVAPLMDGWRFTLEMLRLYPPNSVQPYMDAWCADARDHQQRLYRRILAPLEPLLQGVERLRLVLYPTLPVLPLAALHDGERYLVDRFELAWLPAVPLLREGRAPAATGRPVVVGYSDGGRLPYALAEAERVTAALGARGQSPVLLTEEAATEAALRAHLPVCPLLHLATHATFRADNPFLSWVRLADARLTVADLYDLTLSGRPLVVLSACETGLIGQRGGGLIGLSRAFLAAGASALVVSLWKVDDAVTTELMAEFYAAYATGMPPAAALRRAQRQILVRHPHPFYWAPFALIGPTWRR